MVVVATTDGLILVLIGAHLPASASNDNTHAIVCGAVLMTTVTARVHPVHLMNAD